MSLSDVQNLVDDLVRDAGDKVSPTQRDQKIALALTRYSRDRPRRLVEDVASAGGRFLPLPTAWIPAFTVLLGIEFPIGEVPPAAWPAVDFGIYQSPTSEEIYLARALSARGTASTPPKP